MSKEYKRTDSEDFYVSEYHQSREHADSSRGEYFERCNEYWTGTNEYADDRKAASVTDGENAALKEKSQKRHKKLMRKMLYAVASAATVVAISRTMNEAYSNGGDSNGGDSKVKELIESDIYAYGDLNGDQRIDDVDMQLGLATELCCKYFWEEGGMLEDYFGITRPSDLEDRIIITADGTYRADGSQVSLGKYRYEINLGVDHTGNPVDVSGSVYALRSNTDILVYDGRDFYIRDLKSDAVSFNEKTDDDKAICVCSDFESAEKLKINGNGGGSYQNINPEDSNMFTVFLSNEKFVNKYNTYYNDSRLEDYFADREICTKLRIMNSQKTYVAINKEAGEGEPKRVPGINFDSSDSVCETGDNKYIEVFAGDDILHINPISGATGLTNTEITDVSLSTASQTDGIVLTKNSDEDYEIEFRSNDYDEATIEITYDDGTTSSLTIKRQTLVISYEYLMDDGEGVRTYNIFHGNEQSSTSVDYNYNEGQQIIIYATFYHPSNYTTESGDNNEVLNITDENGLVRIIEPKGYTAATNNTVATTDYIIDLVPAKEENPDGTWGKPLDNISLTPIRAFVGNGQGVYWDGKIRWYY